jgi:hypothetical protein
MSLQLVLAPLQPAHATSLLDIVNGASQIYGQIQANRQMNMPSPHAGAFQSMEVPQPDKYFNLQQMQQLPGLMQYLALNNINPNQLNCATLPTTLTEIRSEACRSGASPLMGNPQMQFEEMRQLNMGYTRISDEVYRNYLAEGNSAQRQLFGIGCMKNAMQILNGYFAYRVDELNKLTTNLEALNNQFREASRADLNALEELTAVLDGGNADFVNNVRTRRPDLFQFDRQFGNPQCASIMGPEAFGERGREGGLNRISNELRTILTDKPQGSRYSAESYTQAHANIVQDLVQMTDKVARQAQLNFTTLSDPNNGFSNFLRSLGSSISSTTGSNTGLSADLFADAQQRFTERNNELIAERDLIRQAIPSAGGALNSLANPNSPNFENDVMTIQNNIKNQCLARNLSNLDGLLSRISDPLANRGAPSNVRERIRQILQNNATTLEQKRQEIAKVESDNRNRLVMQINAPYSYTVVANGENGARAQEIPVSANASGSPSVFFGHVMQTCESQFQINRLGGNNSMTGAEAVQRLRNLRQNYQNLSATTANDLRNSLRQRMIECSDRPITTGSCESGSFNNARPGFCANNAFTCAQNIQGCARQAQQIAQQHKQQRTQRANNYKQQVEKNKRDIIRIFDTALAQYMREGEALRSIFGVGFRSPEGIQREVPEARRYLANFKQATQSSEDGQLLLEDPDAYVDIFKRNIANLRAQVELQQSNITGDRGPMGQHIATTQRNYENVQARARQLAEQCQASMDRFRQQQEQLAQQQQEQQNQLGERRQEFCDRFSMANSNPVEACNGNLRELSSTATQLGGRESAQEFIRFCSSINNRNQDGSTRSPFTWTELCRKATQANDQHLTSAELRTEISELCERRRTEAQNCRPETTRPAGTGAGAERVTVGCQNVEDLSAEIVAAYTTSANISGGTNGQITIDQNMPAFCSAGFDGQRGGNPFMEAFSRGLAGGQQQQPGSVGR